MIDPAAYIFYLGYGVLCVIAILVQIKVQSTETITITTPEFKSFQWNFLMGYLASILGEILSVASFYSTILTISLDNEQIAHLFVISILASTLFGLLIEIIDFGSKRTKCVLSAVLFALASLTLFSSHYDILILGRILYGGGSVLLHSGFDSYLIHEHNSQGFPDDWLNNTFGRLVHSMVIVTMLSGPPSSSPMDLTPPPCPPRQACSASMSSRSLVLGAI
jgi:MFS transporter, MFS domain-containing protein family, molybdate-anion transporter